MARILEQAQRFLLDLVFPPRCAGCGRSGTIWCFACEAQLKRLPPQTCSRCGQPFPPGGCPTCSHRRLNFPVTAYGRYAPPLDRALTHLKYRPDRSLAAMFAAWLEASYRGCGWEADCIVPVPLGRKRQRQRGYNQVMLIATALGARLAMPVLPTAMTRTRETGTQVGLTPAERKRNVSQAFSADPLLIHDRAPLLLDDVYTTGATLTACARALRQAGAARVFGMTVARA